MLHVGPSLSSHFLSVSTLLLSSKFSKLVNAKKTMKTKNINYELIYSGKYQINSLGYQN